MRLLRRIAPIALAASVLSSASSVYAQAPSPAGAASAAAAKASMADGDKAAKNKDWRSAVASYDAANKAAPSEPALEALANAYYQLGDLGGAFSAYTEWMDKYGAKTPAKKKTVEARLQELTSKTGGVVITVSEPGAAIMVDGKQVGVSPLPGQLRLAAGAHSIKITKDGFLAFDQSPNVAAGTQTKIDAKLVSANAKTKVTVTEKTGKPIRVVIDGLDRGPAPFTGEIEPGAHEVLGRGAGFAAPPQKIVVERDKPLQIDLVASSTSAPVKVSTADLKGSIYIDGALVGEGTFQGELGSGTHDLKIVRDGYDTYTEQLVVADRDPVNKTYTLTLSNKVETQEVEESEWLEGLYGGFTLLGVVTPGGTGSSLETQCDRKGEIPTLRTCETPGGFGGGVGGFFGYHWDPVGIELFVEGAYDTRTLKNTWDSASAIGAIGGDPARDEEFTLRRAGGVLAPRVRVTKQWRKFRITIPFGVGIAYRFMGVERYARAATTGAENRYNSDTATYVSPAILVEPSIGYRLSKGVAVTLGFRFLLEAPGTALDETNPTTQRGGVQRLGFEGLSTPAYELASNAQVFIGPTLGMMFGP